MGIEFIIEKSTKTSRQYILKEIKKYIKYKGLPFTASYKKGRTFLLVEVHDCSSDTVNKELDDIIKQVTFSCNRVNATLVLVSSEQFNFTKKFY